MRLFWVGFLITSLLLLGVPISDGNAVPNQKGGSITPSRAEDGTGFPQPYPTPTPSPSPSPSPTPGPRK